MLKIISFLLLAVFAFADIIKIYAKDAKVKNNIIYLQKPYLIYNDNFFIEANRAIIKDKTHALFEGNVTIFYKNSVFSSQKVEMISKKNIKINYSFYYDRELDIWFKNRIAKIKNQNIISFKDAIFSSCCVDNPDWFLYIKSGSFNKKTKYLKINNIVLYIHNVPVFYFPFFFNSLNKERRSGLLRPYIGFSANEGFLYSQPIYFATSLRTDLELDPTIRTKRGKGIYNTFRFVDSPYSFGTFKTGLFVDFDKYFTENNLAHKKHFGYQFNYKRDKVFDNDKLYIDINYANDVDYFYLNPKNYTFDKTYLTDKIITSKINYIKELNNSIFGIYNRYFINTALLNNEETLQVLPQINYHIYEKKYNFLLTSFDYNFYNYYSEKGNRYFINSFNIPFALDFNIFHNFLNVRLSEILKAEYGNYYNSSVEPSYYLNTYSQLKLSSSFTKKDGYIHIITPQITFNFKNYNKDKIEGNIINYTKIQNSIALDLFQIFQNKELYIDHSLHQFYNLGNSSSESMENQLNLYYKNFTLKENNKFDWSLKRVTYNALTLTYQFSNNTDISLSHIYQYSPKLKTIDIKFDKGINKYKKIYFEYNYDIINRYPKFWLFGINLNKKCWQYDLNFKKSLTPVLKENGISYNVDYVLSFSVNFYPIGGLKQSILFK